MANPLYDRLFGRHAGKTTPFLHLADGTTLTHQDFLVTAARFANAIQKLGLSAGDRVAAQIDNPIRNGIEGLIPGNRYKFGIFISAFFRISPFHGNFYTIRIIYLLYGQMGTGTSGTHAHL